MKKIGMYLWFVALVALMLSFAHPAAAQGVEAVALIQGTRQGIIEGDVTLKGREKTIEVLGFGQGASIPFDPASGMRTGALLQQPIQIFKPFDKASPKLFQALITGEILSSVEIKFFRLTPAGTMQHFYSILLFNAYISDLNSTMGGAQMQELAGFVYQRIELQDVINGTVVSADWGSPKV